MIPHEVKQQAKQVSIVEYLLSLGISPASQSGETLAYLSPLKEEKTPSFMVRPSRNRYTDFSTNGRESDVIELVRRLQNCSYPKAIEILQNFKGSNVPFSFTGYTSTPIATKDKSSIRITAVQEVRHRYLWHYSKERGISTKLVKAYLKELHYECRGKDFYTLGFQNDKGGWATRNSIGKPCIGTNSHTTIAVPNSQSINLFEGFMDFLSCCEYKGLIQPPNTTIVLNSIHNLSDALIEQIKGYKQANIYFDNDDAGKQAFNRIRAKGVNVYDGSKHYRNHKDFNEFLTQKQSINRGTHSRA